MNPENGYKITEFYESARVCDSGNMEDVEKCMSKLREFHANKYKVGHEFDLFKQIEFYETLWGGTSSVYRDYEETKISVFRLKAFVDKYLPPLTVIPFGEPPFPSPESSLNPPALIPIYDLLCSEILVKYCPLLPN